MTNSLRASSVWLSLAGLAVLLCLPFTVVDLPPLLDLPNHVARYLLMAQDMPSLAEHYRVDIRPLPNLLGDLIAMATIPVLGIWNALALLLMLCILLPVLGCVLLNRALFGGLDWWPLVSGLFAFHAMFLLGFVNFSLGAGVAILVAAMWVAWSSSRPVLAAVAFAPAALLAALAHAYAFLFLVILVGSFELAGAWVGRRHAGAALRRLALRGAGLSVVSLPALWLSAQSIVTATAVSPSLWGDGQRLAAALSPFSAYQQRLDAATAVAFIGLFGTMLLLGRVRLHPMATIGLAALGAMFLVTPLHSGYGGFAAPRFPVFAALLMCAGARPALAGLPRVAAQGLVAALIVAKLGMVTMTWAAHAPQLAELRRALQFVQPGDRIGTVGVARTEATQAYFNDQRTRALLSFSYERTDGHLGALAMVERGAVWPDLFAAANQQPLVRIGPFAQHPVGGGYGLAPRGVLHADIAPVEWPRWAPESNRRETEAGWLGWRDGLDYILVLHGRAASDHAGFLPERLELLHDAGFAVLYRVRRP